MHPSHYVIEQLGAAMQHYEGRIAELEAEVARLNAQIAAMRGAQGATQQEKESAE